ncbi:MAG TPA: hypothetical protein VFW33_15240, partial [Gemmataceae bacterium]|nr:hypothetical protein [Gemmataceae bacterium]
MPTTTFTDSPAAVPMPGQPLPVFMPRRPRSIDDTMPQRPGVPTFDPSSPEGRAFLAAMQGQRGGVPVPMPEAQGGDFDTSTPAAQAFAAMVAQRNAAPGEQGAEPPGPWRPRPLDDRRQDIRVPQEAPAQAQPLYNPDDPAIKALGEAFGMRRPGAPAQPQAPAQPPTPFPRGEADVPPGAGRGEAEPPAKAGKAT